MKLVLEFIHEYKSDDHAIMKDKKDTSTVTFESKLCLSEDALKDRAPNVFALLKEMRRREVEK